jgi:glycosyltransferase involved in cell wall biosynthesis
LALIRAGYPDGVLHIYGAYPLKSVAAHNVKRFHIMGRAEDVKKWLKCSVVLAPLRFGAGLKGKLLQAMVWYAQCNY